MEADRRKDEFLPMLAHELRNPLAPFTTGVHLLRNSAGSQKAVLKVADMMGRQLQHMTRLVDDLLDVARLTRGSIELRKASVALRDVLAQAVEVSRPYIEARSHRPRIEAAPDVYLEADSTRLVQVFTSLPNNSAKYTAPGGEIALTCEVTRNDVTVAVRDSGEGIDSALLPYVFDLFTQGSRSLDRTQGGRHRTHGGARHRANAWWRRASPERTAPARAARSLDNCSWSSRHMGAARARSRPHSTSFIM